MEQGDVMTVINHFIILSDAWSTHTRIAPHYPYEGKSRSMSFHDDYKRIQNCFVKGKAQIAFHFCQTSSYTWESVVEKDGYFDDVKVIDSVEEFIDIIRMDELPDSSTIGRYIMNLTQCDRTKLNILTYISYAEYLCGRREPLFKDRMRSKTGSRPRIPCLKHSTDRP